MKGRFSQCYEAYLNGSYDCVDRIVLNASGHWRFLNWGRPISIEEAATPPAPGGMKSPG